MRCKCMIYSTGFNAVNLPIDMSVIFDNYTPVYDDYIFINTEILQTIKINLSFEKAYTCDYVVIYNENIKAYFCYTIENVKMLNDTTAEFLILADALNSLGGVYNIKISGSVERYCVPHSEDVFGAFTLPESFSPNKPLTLEISSPIGDTKGSFLNIIEVCLEVDGSKRADVLQPTEQTENNERLLLPQTQPIQKSSVDVGDNFIPAPMSRYYDNSSGQINEKINLMRQYGLDNSILNAYALPKEYGSLDGLALSGKVKDYSPSGVNINYSNVINKKVLCGEFNKLILASNCSGEKIESLPEDVSSDGTTPKIHIISDPRATGKPTAQFAKYKKIDLTKTFMFAVNGLNWQNTPIVWTDKSGSNLDRLNFNTNKQVERTTATIQNIQSAVGGVIGAASALGGEDKNVAGAIGSVVGAVVDIGLREALLDTKTKAEKEIFERSQYYVQPEISFPRSEGVRDFYGNHFYLVHYKLDETDIVQYDTYLTRFGYNVANVLYEKDKMLMSRQKFQYLKFREVYIYEQTNKSLREQAETQLKNGIRFWKVKPTAEALQRDGNP